VLIITVFTQVLLPILLMFSAGWLLDRKWNVDLATVVKLNLNLFVPAFIVFELTTKQVNGSEATRAIGYTLTVVVILFVAAGLVARACRYSHAQTRSLQIAAIFYNSANYGIPLMTLAFPHQATLQVFVILVQNIGNFTVGVFLISSVRHPGWKALSPVLRQTSVWAVAIALTLRGCFGPLDPHQEGMRWLWEPLRYFHDGLVAVALITLGVQLSKTKATAALPRLRPALALRLLGGPLVGWALVGLFGFQGEAASAMILSASFPTAVNTALIAHEFNADTEYAAGAVFWSTLLSMISVTLLITVLKATG